jgi:6-phosphogluconate dehydrogenase
MRLGMIGLGRMGSNMVRRLAKAGHHCVVYDVSPEPGALLAKELGAEHVTRVESIAELVRALEPPRAVWMMVPAAVTAKTLDEVVSHLAPGDIAIDGGNSYYRDDVDRAESLAPKGIHYVDCGTSGGVFGLERGYCLMIGGPDEAVAVLEPIFEALAPGFESAERTPARTGDVKPAERGWLHCGPSGAGHFVKMVHNGIEYGLMAAYAEGLAILAGANAGSEERPADAETAPLSDPRYYRFDLDLAEITEVWRRGSVVASWLLDLTADALARDPDLSSFEGRVSDSGEGRWTSIAAIEEGVPAPLLTTALYDRFASRGAATLANKVQSAQRKEFGGHDERTE